MKYANSRTAPYAVRQFAPAKGYIFRESFIQHDNIEVLKTGRYDPGKDNVLTAVYGIPGQAWDWVDPNEKYYVDRFETDAGQIYAGEFMIATGLGTDTWFAPNTEDLKRHYEEIRDYATNYDNGKMPYDFDVAYDIAAIKDAVSAYDDIERMIDEETAKFIAGTRSLNEWDDFIASLKKIGGDRLYAEYTSQYKEIKGL